MPAGAGQHISALWMANFVRGRSGSQTRLRLASALAFAAGERRLDAGEGLADPRTLVFARLQAAGPHQPVGVGIPGAVREVVSEHCCRGLRLAGNAKRKVSLGETHQRLLDVPG